MSAYRPRHGYRQTLSWPRPEWERPFTTHLYVDRHRRDALAKGIAAAVAQIPVEVRDMFGRPTW